MLTRARPGLADAWPRSRVNDSVRGLLFLFVKVEQGLASDPSEVFHWMSQAYREPQPIASDHPLLLPI